MKRFRENLFRLFRLPPLATALVALPSFALVIYVLATGQERVPLAYAAYPLSAYALTVVCVGVPGIVRALRSAVVASPLMRKILSIPLGERYVRDELFRAEVGQYRSLFINLIFAALKLGAGIALRSLWFGALGVYYLLLAFMRSLLFRRGLGEPGENVPAELRRCRQCGVVLLAMSLSLAIIVGMMVDSGASYRYPGLLIYVAALYAFYAVPVAAVNLVKFRSKGSPALYAAKALNLVAALVSLLALETAMLARFGGGAAFRRSVVGISGACVCAAALTAAVVMIARASRGLRAVGA